MTWEAQRSELQEMLREKDRLLFAKNKLVLSKAIKKFESALDALSEHIQSNVLLGRGPPPPVPKGLRAAASVAAGSAKSPTAKSPTAKSPKRGGSVPASPTKAAKTNSTGLSVSVRSGSRSPSPGVGSPTSRSPTMRSVSPTAKQRPVSLSPTRMSHCVPMGHVLQSPKKGAPSVFDGGGGAAVPMLSPAPVPGAASNPGAGEHCMLA